MSKKLFFLLMIAAVLSFAGLMLGQGQGRGGRDDQLNMPDGPGKDILQSACTECHNLQMAVGTGYNREEWGLTLERMITAGAKMTPDQIPVVTDYLLKNLAGEGPKPAVIVPGSVTVSFKEWGLPTKGSRPHDPWAAPDGSIWYSGMYANVIGHVDPKTGQIKEYHLKTPRSGPHGLVGDKEGNIWFTANSKSYIGKLNPKTGDVTEYKLPEGARDPHTPIFDQKGTLFFTVQGANMIGRLDPKTGDIKIVTSPTPRSLPYGMVVSSKGVPFLVEFGAPKRWRSKNTRCRTKSRGRGASRLPVTTSSGTRIIRAVTWGGWIRKREM